MDVIHAEIDELFVESMDLIETTVLASRVGIIAAISRW